MTANLLPILFSLICGFAATVQGAIGIGFPLIATPLLAMVTDIRTAILILVLPTMALNIANIVKGGTWSKSIVLYWPLAIYSILGSFLGTRLLIGMAPETFRPLLAGVIILYLNAERLGVRFSWVSTHPRIAMAVFGLGAGLLGGTVNVMLPALVIFALETRMDKIAMIQVFNFCFLFGKLAQGAVLLKAGFLTFDILYISAPLTVLSLAVMFATMAVRNRLKESTYRQWLRRLLFVIATILLVQFFISLSA